MNWIKDFFGLKMLCNGSKKEAIWLWLAFSVWIPYVLSGTVIGICFFVILLSPELRKIVVGQKRMFLFGAAIGALSFISAATAGNLLGLVIAFGVFVEIFCGCFLRGTVEREIFNKASAILGYGSVAACIVAVIQHEVIYRNPDYRPTAGAFNANYYGALIVFTLIMIAIRFMEKDPEAGDALKWYHLPKWVWLLMGLVNVFALLYCRSRSSLLALMACAFIYLVLARRWLLAAVCTVGFAGIWLIGYFRPELFDWQNSLTEGWDMA